jgi:hypothetical protein
MSKEQLTEQQGQGQQDAATRDAGGNDGFVEGLPAPLHAKVMAVPPGDANALGLLLKEYGPSSFGRQILAVAARTLGNAVVQRAIKIAETRSRPTVAPGSQNRADMNEALHDASDPPEVPGHGPPKATGDHEEMLRGLEGSITEGHGLRPEVRQQVLALRPGDAAGLADLLRMYSGTDLEGDILMVAREHLGHATVAKAVDIKHRRAEGTAGSQGAAMHMGGEFDPATAGPGGGERAKPEHDAAWFAAARAYNAAHAELVDEFNELTDDNCLMDAARELDPQVVAHWQRNHGVPADGKVGPHTVATARKAKAKAPEVSAVSPTEARPPV